MISAAANRCRLVADSDGRLGDGVDAERALTQRADGDKGLQDGIGLVRPP